MRKTGKKSGSGVFQQVFALTAAIPAGKVATYGLIAKCLHGFYSGRTVGFAMRSAPADRNLPCHRVVNRKGEMSPGHVFGGAERQRKILRKEGVSFRRDGTVNLEKSLHRFDELAAILL
jgi:methylated-DNA-protein-cysteine methyltransferase-like protein